MVIIKLTLGPLATNCWLVAENEGGPAAVVDPVDEAPVILDAAREAGLKIEKILLTHTHFDHILALAAMKRETGASVGVHEAEQENIKSAERSGARRYGFTFEPCPADFLIAEGDRIQVGGLELLALHTPGHSPGGISFYIEARGDEPAVVFSGDALFHQSIGRTDFPGCSHEALLSSIREKLFTLPDDTIVLSGHGPETTIGDEKRHNPFVGVDAVE